MKTSRHLSWTTTPHRILITLLLVGLLLNPTLPLAVQAATGVNKAGISSVRLAVLTTEPPPRTVATVDEIALDSPVTLPPGASADWWVTVQEDIRQSEYHITWQERTCLADLAAAYQAPNRAHNLRTYFTPQGIRVVPRVFEGDAPPWEWELTLSGYGCACDMQNVAAPTLHAETNRIEYERDVLTEGYVNDEQGLEQGFTLHRPPQSAFASPQSEIVLEMVLGGDLTPQITDDGSAVEFATPGGVRVLRYGELAVYDAHSRTLPARLELTPHAIRLVFDTAALYPVTIDSTITGLFPTPAWTAESDQAGAGLGQSVGTAGDVNGDGYSDVIVGAPYYDNGETNEGRAYVYHGGASGLSATPAWIAESNQADAEFGCSVGTAGDVNGDGYSDVIVGSRNYTNGETNEGRAYVYRGGASGLSATPTWSAESDQANARFGDAVATAGDVNGDGYSDVIVGAYAYANEGRSYVYHGAATGLSATPAWTAEGDQIVADFGSSVGTAGDVDGDGYSDVIVGAPGYNNDQSDEGRVYVYRGSASGLSTTPAWTAEGDQDGAHFGSSVGTAGDVDGDGYSDVIVGVPLYDNGQTDEGRAYVYHGGASGLNPFPAWMPESNQADAYFGAAVGTAGDVNGDGYSDVIVGAPYYDNGETNEGWAYVYHGGASGLSATPDWTAESNQAAAIFGSSVGTAGDVNGDGYSDVIAGSPYYTNGQSAEGRAYVYHGSAGGLSATPAWTAESDQDGAWFGRSVATAGDVNGDGYGDVIVGANHYDNGQSNEGRAFVYHGGASGLSSSPAWTAESDQIDAEFGNSVGTAGDVDGDGYSDVIVGAHYYTNGETNEGRVYVYHGGLGGLSAAPDWTAESNQAGAIFGSVGTAGDVDGDGYGDVIVGASRYDNGETDEGRAYVYRGAASGLSATPDWTAESNQAGAWFGISVGTAGDVDGDGYSDVIVGANHYDDGQTDEGRAYVYRGGASGLSSSPDWTAESDQDSAWLGSSVGTAGDVNGDGYSDVIVGADYYDNGEIDEGRAYIYHGGAGGLSSTPAWTAESNQVDAWFGRSVGTAGDVNGDGYSDVIAGALSYDNGETDEGRTYVYHGGPGGCGKSAWIAESDQGGAYFGISVGTAGDVNGDGYSDVIIGASLYDNPQSAEGRGFVYYGNGGDGLHLLPRQLHTDGSTPIAHLGRSDSNTAFQVRLIGRTPLGREQVKLQWQVAPLSVAFGDPSVIEGFSPAWLDTGTGGVEINQTITGLMLDTPYHWRVRVLYRPGNVLGQAASRWVHIPWAGWNETDLRTGTRIWVHLPFVLKNR